MKDHAREGHLSPCRRMARPDQSSVGRLGSIGGSLLARNQGTQRAKGTPFTATLFTLSGMKSLNWALTFPCLLSAMENQIQLARANHRPSKEADTYKRLGEICSKYNLFEDAVRYFGERRRLLERSSTDLEEQPILKQQATLDYARCLLMAGDDLEAVRAFEELFELMETTDPMNPGIPATEIGLVYRDQGWCWYRLGNFDKASEALESALDFLERSVVDAAVKCDCYRGLAAVELAMGRSERALAQLNRRLQFVRSIGFTMEEPKALCDLAYVHLRSDGDSRMAEELARSALMMAKDRSKSGDKAMEFRAMTLLTVATNECWNEALDVAMEAGLVDWFVMVLALQGKNVAEFGMSQGFLSNHHISESFAETLLLSVGIAQ